MQKATVYKELLRHLARLRHGSCDLKSKMTSLMLYVEDCHSLSENKKKCIINVVSTIATKNEELISAEDQLTHVIDLFFQESSSGRRAYRSFLEDGGTI